MDVGLYMSTAGMQVADYRQTLISNNLANAETVGFKRDLSAVMSRPLATQEDSALSAFQDRSAALLGGGVFAAPNTIDLTQGTLKQTGAPLDVSLEGKGFFTVQGSDGKSYLTRDGRFTMNSAGELVNMDGRAVLSDSGTPITLNPTAPVAISSNGQIRQNDSTVATLGLMTPKDPSQLSKLGDNLLTVRDPATLTPATGAQVHQGALEQSGVDPTVEMVNMMQNQRIYDANAKMIQSFDRLSQTLNQVGRVA